MKHYNKLENMYLSAPLHEFYDTLNIKISKNECEIKLQIDPKYFHAGDATHGSVYFKLLDDAAYFAIQSVIDDYFIVTKSFNIDLIRPLTEGEIIAKGRVVKVGDNEFIGEAELFSSNNKLVGKGRGVFVKSKTALSEIKSYGTKNG